MVSRKMRYETPAEWTCLGSKYVPRTSKSEANDEEAIGGKVADEEGGEIRTQSRYHNLRLSQ
jgi:hypothetical protein